MPWWGLSQVLGHGSSVPAAPQHEGRGGMRGLNPGIPAAAATRGRGVDWGGWEAWEREEHLFSQLSPVSRGAGRGAEGPGMDAARRGNRGGARPCVGAGGRLWLDVVAGGGCWRPPPIGRYTGAGAVRAGLIEGESQSADT